MDRLTFEGNFCDIAQCLEMRGGKHCPDGYCSQRRVWERLKEYEDAEQDGRLVALPDGKIGDVVKWNNGASFLHKEISSIIICQDGLRYDLGDFSPFVTDTRISKILNTEEAEAALTKGEYKDDSNS